MDKHLDPYFDLLGRTVKDRVTGFEGTVILITFDLYGCIQAITQPRVDKDKKVPDGRCFDVNRLEPVDQTRTMPAPTFEDAATTIALLGRCGHDRVTDFEGTVSSIAFTLGGKMEIALSPRVDVDNKFPDGKWIDAGRVTLVGDARVMDTPHFQPSKIAAQPSQHAHGPTESHARDPRPEI